LLLKKLADEISLGLSFDPLKGASKTNFSLSFGPQQGEMQDLDDMFDGLG
jgi:hypothetical protein